MKPIEELLRNLARPDVLEFGLVTNRLPSVNVGGRFEPVDDQAPTTEALLNALAAMGGARFVESLGEKPVQWTARLDGVGVIAIAAIMRKDVVQARFTVARRDPTGRMSSPPSAARSGAIVKATPSAAPPAPAPAPPPVSAKGGEPDEDDDDEPTVQTLSPGTGTGEAKPKPARKPEEVARPVPPRPTPPEPEERTEERPLPASADNDATEATITQSGEDEQPAIDASAGIEALLSHAALARATDVFVAAGRPVTVRIAGELSARTQPVDAEHVERIVRDVVPERLRPAFEEGRACDFALDHPEHGRFRVHASRARTGSMLSLRAIARDLPSLPEDVLATVRVPSGLVLVSGPPGHGKSTTLAALVAAIDAAEPRHVATVEDPIERVHARRLGIIHQREIGTHTRSWTSAVDDALAADADVVVLGDLHHADAVHALLVACASGRLVLATANAPAPAKALELVATRVAREERARARRILESATRAVIGQRLENGLPSFDVVSGPAARRT